MDDAERLFAWRNDPLTRANARNSDPIEYPAHLAWLAATLKNPALRLLVIESNREPAATARFDYDDPTEFSFCIAPSFRGKALSLKLMRTAIEAEPDHISHVLKHNTPCQRLLAACGARLLQDGPVQTWRYEAQAWSAGAAAA